MSKPFTEDEKQKLLAWAQRALKGLDESVCFVGLLDGRPLDAARAAFTLQLGHCVLTNKPLILPVPVGVEVPSKLAAVADRIVRYDPDKPESLGAALAQALTEMGFKKQ